MDEKPKTKAIVLAPYEQNFIYRLFYRVKIREIEVAASPEKCLVWMKALHEGIPNTHFDIVTYNTAQPQQFTVDAISTASKNKDVRRVTGVILLGEQEKSRVLLYSEPEGAIGCLFASAVMLLCVFFMMKLGALLFQSEPIPDNGDYVQGFFNSLICISLLCAWFVGAPAKQVLNVVANWLLELNPEDKTKGKPKRIR